MFMFSCQEVEDAKISRLNSFEDMNKITNELVTFNASNLSTFIDKESDGSFWLDKHQMAVSSFKHLDGILIDASGIDLELLSKSFRKERIERSNFSSRVMNFDYGNYNLPQAWFADQFITNLLAVDDLSEVTPLVFSFNVQVLNSLLPQEDKDELLLLSSTVLSIRDFLLNDGINILYNEMVLIYGDPTNPSDPSFGGRIQGCSINTKEVFRSGVWGLVKGAAVGVYVGAAGGTVIIPGVGSVTGAVSGAVLGGAYGFVSNSIESMASQLFWSCFEL